MKLLIKKNKNKKLRLIQMKIKFPINNMNQMMTKVKKT